MSLAIAMLVAYIPFLIWVYQEHRDQVKEAKKHK